MQNCVAEFLNMEGRRGDKAAFVKYKILTMVAGNYIFYNLFIYVEKYIIFFFMID